MEYIFSRKEFERLKKIVRDTERRLSKTTDAKAESGGGQDGWHDESFRVLLVEEQMWSRRFSELKVMLNSARVLEPKEQKEAVSFGNGVKIRYEDSGDVFDFLVEGYLIKTYEHKVSIQSPIAQGLLGANKGEKRTLSIGGRNVKVEILDIFLPSEVEKMIPQD